MNKKNYFLILYSFILGTIFFAFQNEILVFRFPKIIQENLKDEKNKIFKKNINLFFWNNSKWNSESIEIIWSKIISENVFYITSNWLNLLDEEKILDKKVSLQNVLSSSNNKEMFLSFDRSLFNEESSTFEKLIIIESLLKTLRENEIDIQKIYLLVHNQEMKDTHLDFSHGWPLQGFLNKN